MKKRYSLFLPLILFVVLYACTAEPNTDWKVKIENKTRDNLVCVLGYNYPDLSLSFIDKKAILAKGEQFEIEVCRSKVIEHIGLMQKRECGISTIKDGNMLMLIVFDKINW